MKLFFFRIFFVLAFCFVFIPVSFAEQGALSSSKTGHGWLGVSLKQITAAEAGLQSQGAGFVLIDGVFAESPAERGGVERGDIVLSIDGEAVNDVENFIKKIKYRRPGDKVVLTRLSATNRNQKSTSEVLLGLRPENPETFNMDLNRPLREVDLIDVRSGREMKISELKGKVVLVDFWATWCGPCRSILPRLAKISQLYRPHGLEVVGVSSENARDIRSFVKKNPLPYTIATYPKIMNPQKYNVTSLPTLYLVDKSGIVRKIQVGAGDLTDLENEILKLLK